TLGAFRPDFVVIDSLSRTHSKNENSVQEMQSVLSAWSDLAQDYQCAVAVIHHPPKIQFESGAASGQRIQIRGTGAILAMERHVIGAENRSDGTVKLSFDGNLGGLPEPFVLCFDFDGTDDNGKKVICARYLGSEAETKKETLDAQSAAIDRAVLEA